LRPPERTVRKPSCCATSFRRSVLLAFSALIAGLTPEGAEERRCRYGSNDILEDRRAGWDAIARDTARDPMAWFLAATAFLFTLLGEYAEASALALGWIEPALHGAHVGVMVMAVNRPAPDIPILRCSTTLRNFSPTRFTRDSRRTSLPAHIGGRSRA
jgi:hypothetical protein